MDAVAKNTTAAEGGMSMGVYIKGMEMPTSCGNCPMCHSNAEYDYAYCCVSSAETSGNKIPSGCPLVPVPPHGRLIDADELMHEFEKAQQTMAQHGREYSCSFMSSSQEISTEWYCVEDMLENAPTIIPAEEGE